MSNAGLVSLAVSVSLSGCGPWYSHNSLQFSPDSGTVAFALHERWDKWPPPDSPELVRTETVCWAPASEPSRMKSVAVQTVLDYNASAIRLIFSPNSRHLLAVSTKVVTCIDLQSGSARRLNGPGEWATTAAWLNSHEVGYVTHTNRRRDPTGQHGETTDRVFWKQDVATTGSRTRVHEQADVTDAFRVWGTFNERCSPDGRHVVFAQSADQGPVQCLDVQTGRIRELGPSQSHLRAAVWKPDGSAVMCILQNRDRPRTQALLINPDTGARQDFTTDFVETFGSDVIHHYEWTAEGEFILIHDSRLGLCLFRPHPWKIIEIERKLKAGFADDIHWVQVAPMPGQVIAWGGGCQGFMPAASMYLSDLEAVRVQRLVTRGSRGYPECLSPDGRLLARVEHPSRLVVLTVELEPVQPVAR